MSLVISSSRSWLVFWALTVSRLVGAQTEGAIPMSDADDAGNNHQGYLEDVEHHHNYPR